MAAAGGDEAGMASAVAIGALARFPVIGHNQSIRRFAGVAWLAMISGGIVLPPLAQ